MSLKHQLQPNAWSCLITSFANVVEVNIVELTELIGHDGSEIVFPDLEDPLKRRSFHIQEIYEALNTLQYCVQPYHFYPVSMVDFEHKFAVPGRDQMNQFVLENYDMVVEGNAADTGNRHACVWWKDEQKFFDPRGQMCDAPLRDITTAYIVRG